MLACVAGVRRGGKGERRAREAHEAREDRTREDRGRGRRTFSSTAVKRLSMREKFHSEDLQKSETSFFCSQPFSELEVC